MFRKLRLTVTESTIPIPTRVSWVGWNKVILRGRAAFPVALASVPPVDIDLTPRAPR